MLIKKSITTKHWSCNWCHLTFSSNHELKGHLLVHGEYERSFLCESCDQTFSKVQQLQHHRQIHASTKPFSCITCGKDLKSAKALDIHEVMKHTESEKIQCRQCPRRVFRNEATLKVHLEGHKESKVPPPDGKRCVILPDKTSPILEETEWIARVFQERCCPFVDFVGSVVDTSTEPEKDDVWIMLIVDVPVYHKKRSIWQCTLSCVRN